MEVVSYLAAVLTAVANATANVLNRKAALEEPDGLQFRSRMIFDLLRRRTWLIAMSVMLLTYVTGTIALALGRLSVVQPIMVIELPLTLIGATRFLGAQMSRRDWIAIIVMTVGLAALLAFLHPRQGPGRVPAAAWIFGTAANGGAILVLIAAGKTHRRPPVRAALLGAACGLAYGLTAAYAKGMTQQFASGGIVGVVVSWEFYASIAGGLTATWLLQNAYYAGQLAAAQPGITVLDPIAAIIWGMLAFGEQTRQGFYLALAGLALVAIAWGAVELSRSPCLRDIETRTETPLAALTPRHRHRMDERPS